MDQSALVDSLSGVVDAEPKDRDAIDVPHGRTVEVGHDHSPSGSVLFEAFGHTFETGATSSVDFDLVNVAASSERLNIADARIELDQVQGLGLQHTVNVADLSDHLFDHRLSDGA